MESVYTSFLKSLAGFGFVVVGYEACPIDSGCHNGETQFLSLVSTIQHLEQDRTSALPIDFTCHYSASGHSTGARAVLMLAAARDNPEYLKNVPYVTLTPLDYDTIAKVHAVVADHPDPMMDAKQNPDISQYNISTTPTFLITGTLDVIEPTLSAWTDFQMMGNLKEKIFLNIQNATHLNPIFHHPGVPFIAYFCQYHALYNSTAGDLMYNNASSKSLYRQPFLAPTGGARNNGGDHGEVSFLACSKNKTLPSQFQKYCTSSSTLNSNGRAPLPPVLPPVPPVLPPVLPPVPPVPPLPPLPPVPPLPPAPDAEWELFTFAKGDNWTNFVWDNITTVAIFSGWTPLLSSNVLLAHKNNAKVVMHSDLVPPTDATNRTLQIKSLVAFATVHSLDGINLDIEQYTGSKDLLTKYVQELAQAFRTAIPSAQISFDVSIYPMGQPQKDHYDYKALSDVLDFLIPMAYDENWNALSPEPNSPIQALVKGMAEYGTLGIEPNKIVFALPWYGTSWPCVNSTQGSVCEVHLGTKSWLQVVSQPCVSSIVEQIGTRNISAVRLDRSTETKYVEWVDSARQRHVASFDDSETLGQKVHSVKTARGVAMWYAGCVAGESKEEVKDMWSAMGKPAGVVLRL